MDPTGGIAFAAAGVAVIYLLRRHRGRPTQTGVKGNRTRGASGRLPKRSWLVKAYNSTGAARTESEDLSGATAELAGRAAGSAGRRSKRRWTIIKSAAERSRARRETRWQETGRPPLLVTRRPTIDAETAEPATVPKPAKAATPATPSGAAGATPGPEPPKRHLKAVPDPDPTPGDAVTTTQDTPASATLAAPDAPPDWASMADRVRGFAPEDDATLIRFMHGEAAGVVAYAEALEQARENCTNDVGLDPSAVAGFTDYSEYVSDAAERMAAAYKTFLAVYGEVQALAASGVVMPHNGRWFTGAAG